MSYWVYLEHPKTKKLGDVDRFQEGGTQPVGGTAKTELNITYNYAKHFKFRNLHKQRAGNTIDEIQAAVNELGTKRDPDYWNPTKGNVGYALNILLDWAKQYPNYIWKVF